MKKERQEQLIKMYPNADAIGRTFIQDLLNRNNIDNNDPNKDKPTLTVEEIIFLKDRLNETELIIYDEYLQLQEMLARLVNKLMLLQQTFHHGFYRVLYFIQPLAMGLKAYCNSLDLNDDEYKNTCQDFAELIEQGLKIIWKNYVIEILRIMHVYDIHINILTDVSIYKFDYTALSPQPMRYTKDIKAIQNTMLDLVETIKEYNHKTRGQKNKIKISNEAIKVLEEIGSEEIIDHKTLKKFQKITDAFDESKHKIHVEKKFDIYFIRDMMRTIR